MSNDGHWFHERNPLLDAIPAFDDLPDFVERLAFHPTQGLDLKALTIFQRVELLTADKMPLQPTSQSIRIAVKCLGMLRGSLQVRNPIRAENRRRYWDYIKTDDLKKPLLMPSPVSGVSVLVIKGPTGTAKTVTIRRLCNLLPQVIQHGPCEEAGWLSMSQLVYLFTTLSSDGTRGGFLIQMLMDLDRALGTTYATTLPSKFRTIERLAVAVVVRLVAHHTGIIFIDEGQLRNLMKSDQAELMQLFLLALINSGIPVVLMGNELAFDWINYSQDLSRLNTVPTEYCHPVGAMDSDDTEDDWGALSSGILRYYVLPEPIIDKEQCARTLRICSGGNARLGLTLCCETQLEQIFSSATCMGPDDILRTYRGRGFDALRPLAEGFAERRADKLLAYPDVDAAYYARIWEKKTEADEERPPDPTGGTDKKATQGRGKQSEQTKFKAEKTREKNRQKKREELEKTLSDDDIRKKGVQELHIAGLDAMMERLQREVEGETDAE
jgi:hypothetical protein